jgi:hypothetical protein
MTTNPHVHGPSDEEVIAALERTGFLLEHRAAHELAVAGFTTIINDAFPDPETGKSRELDVFAGMDYEIDGTDLAVQAKVLIECKNTPNPYLVVGTNRARWDPLDESVVVTFDPLKFQFPGKAQPSILTQLDLWRNPGELGKELFIGHQLVHMNRKDGEWRADNSSVHDSILYPLVKARQYHIDRNSAAISKRLHNMEEWEFPSITFFFPVLLTTAEVFAVAVNGEEDVTVKRVRWTTMQRIFNSSDLRTTLRMDVVSFAHLHDYIADRVVTTINRAYATLTDNAHLYDPEWLLKNFGPPRYQEQFSPWQAAGGWGKRVGTSAAPPKAPKT